MKGGFIQKRRTIFLVVEPPFRAQSIFIFTMVKFVITRKYLAAEPSHLV